MRKSFITPGGQDAVTPDDAWLDLDRLARVEITSEDRRYPIEGALVPGRGPGWLAGGPGPQTVRLRFDAPQPVRRIWLHFVERAAARTQEFVLRWGTADGLPPRDVVRQQWVFHPRGSTHETEDYRLDLNGVTVLELMIVPDVTGDEALAALAEWRVA
ncbi:hypothetical protein GobsT_41780 [Gemmata obscuriglobus]|uniref:Carbohydrate-binding protein n=1 Tax=Gemmata obscuriglobus TaxID=114 RepID=A0A2Z3GTS0_9BACT|nr:hypothetical protein [Gemmata obscuriglobus]AWM37799.1 carbohydrate-binding protein [Gemmata obscuriglobus]QEG29382.1 hypothetical protein GobsT_41780 [Gemmata obscuriglobus]VTS08437.1 Carbohydrate-binding protein OS=Desulfonatronum thiodismutans GN=GY33_15865 PE=4 SV=1 [Gemmata obscuriglobus UQM 2246]